MNSTNLPDRHAAFKRIEELSRTTTGTAENDPGETIASVPRGDSERLRLARKTWQGKPYLDLRIEFRDRGGEWQPTRKGLSIRRNELRAIGAELLRLAEEAGQ